MTGMTIEEHQHASIERAAAEGTKSVQDSFLPYLQIKQFQLVNTHTYMILYPTSSEMDM
jgi:hypothetical protein